MSSLAEAIGQVLGLSVESVNADHFGPIGNLFAQDQPSSSALTRERFGWQPTHPSLLEDLAAGGLPGLAGRLNHPSVMAPRSAGLAAART